MARPYGETTVAILAALQRGVAYGLDLTQQTGLRTGTVYTTLRRLEQRRLVEGRWEDADVAEAERRPRRRYYGLTPAGEAALAESRDRLAEIASDVLGDPSPATGEPRS